MKIAILASSNKRRNNNEYGRCVAGITETGGWVRLVADEAGDSLAKNNAPKCLRVIEANVQFSPTYFQPENAILLNYKYCNDNISKYIGLHNPPSEHYIFGNHSNHLRQEEMSRASGSLRLLEVKSINIYRNIHDKWKVDFSFNQKRYTDFAMTDPEHYNNEDFNSAYVVISLPNSTGDYSAYYKFVAAIHSLSE